MKALSVARLRRAARRETLGVNVGASLNLVGALVKYLSLAFLFPAAVALVYGESPRPFLLSLAIGSGLGWGLEFVTRGKEQVGVREGFLIVSLTWLLAAGIGALPFLLADEAQFASPIDAYFEAMSGFTTTGASVLTDIPAVSRSLLMWRQFSQWLGGMGIIVLALAVLPRLRVGGRQLFETEAPGPELELTSTIRDTARKLWLLYIGLTVACIAILVGLGAGGGAKSMNLYDATAHAFTTLPTGGFSTRARGLEEFNGSAQWTLTVFMLIAGANFALLYVALLRGRVARLFRDEEFRLYLALLAVATGVLTVFLVQEDLHHGEAAVRHAAFQVVSVMTTTGSASTDFATWSALGAVVLVGLMFIGGSAGSTAGSIKVVRHLLIGRILRRELDQTVHPEIVAAVRLNRRPIDERALRAVIVFVLLYVGLFALGALAISVDSHLTDTTVTPFEAIAAAATTLGNVGPGFGFAGPMGSFAEFSDFSKVVMIVLMWLGRLEIIPIAVLLTKSYWRT